MPRYPNLAAEIAKRGIKKWAIAKRIGISPRALSNKLSGASPFTLEEAFAICRAFFPDVTIETLFSTNP